MLYLDLEWMDHNLHQHLLIRQEAIKVQALALYSLTINRLTITLGEKTIFNGAIPLMKSQIYLTEEHGIVAMQWQVKGDLIWSRL